MRNENQIYENLHTQIVLRVVGKEMGQGGSAQKDIRE